MPDVCDRGTPALRAVERGQAVSCFLYHRDEDASA
jgi:hypothetical protein